MVPSAALTTFAVVVFAVGFTTLMLPRIHAESHRPQAPPFVAMWTATIVGILEGGLLAFLVITVIGPGIGYALALTLPRRATTTMEVLSFVCAGAVILLFVV